MKKLFALLVSAALAAITAPAQDWAKARLEKSPRHQEWVKVKSGGREVNCFIGRGRPRLHARRRSARRQSGGPKGA